MYSQKTIRWPRKNHNPDIGPQNEQQPHHNHDKYLGQYKQTRKAVSFVGRTEYHGRTLVSQQGTWYAGKQTAPPALEGAVIATSVLKVAIEYQTLVRQADGVKPWNIGHLPWSRWSWRVGWTSSTISLIWYICVPCWWNVGLMTCWLWWNPRWFVVVVLDSVGQYSYSCIFVWYTGKWCVLHLLILRW